MTRDRPPRRAVLGLGAAAVAAGGGLVAARTVGLGSEDLSGDRKALGRAQERGARLAVAHFNAADDRPFTLGLSVRDDRGEAPRAVEVAERSCADREIVALLGPTGDAGVEAAPHGTRRRCCRWRPSPRPPRSSTTTGFDAVRSRSGPTGTRRPAPCTTSALETYDALLLVASAPRRPADGGPERGSTTTRLRSAERGGLARPFGSDPGTGRFDVEPSILLYRVERGAAVFLGNFEEVEAPGSRKHG